VARITDSKWCAPGACAVIITWFLIGSNALVIISKELSSPSVMFLLTSLVLSLFWHIEHWLDSLVVSSSVSVVSMLSFLSVVVHENAGQNHEDNSEDWLLENSLIEFWFLFPNSTESFLTGAHDEHSEEESCHANHSNSVVQGKLISVDWVWELVGFRFLMMVFLPPATLLEISTQDLFSIVSGIKSTPGALNGTDSTDGDENPGTDLNSLSPEVDLSGRWLLLLDLSLFLDLDSVVNGDLRLWLLNENFLLGLLVVINSTHIWVYYVIHIK
jgi:hypothetical protein